MRESICTLCLSLILLVSTAQHNIDSTARKNLFPVQVFYKALGEQSPLFNGREYFDYSKTIHVGHPFYPTTDFLKTFIVYDGMAFEDAMILYDIMKDKVIVQHFSGLYMIDLDVEKVQEFRFLNKHFVRLDADSLEHIEEGFYEKLFDDEIALYAKRKKTLREEVSRTDILSIADQKNFFYIKKDGVYHFVKNFKGLLTILRDRKDKIRNHLQAKGLKFRKNREAAILVAVKYYDSLSN